MGEPKDVFERISDGARAVARAVTSGVAPRPRGFRVSGRVVHAKAPGGPLHHVRIELWERDPLLADELLAVTVSDREGRFDVEVEPARIRNSLDAPDVRGKVVWVARSADLEVEERPPRARVFLDHEGADDFTGEHLELGDIAVHWWEYLEDARPLARVDVPLLGPKPDVWTKGYVERKILEGTKDAEQFAKHTALAAAGTLTVEAVQRDYPANPTILDERASPGRTRSDAYVGDLLLNGFNAARPFRKDCTEPGCTLRLSVSFDAYAFDGVHTLPDVDCELAVEGDSLVPKVIRWSRREHGATQAHGPRTDTRTVRPADGADWEEAKRVLRVADYAEGQFCTHLTDTHVNVEQYVIALQRTVRRNPVVDLLGPHLRECVLINHQGTFLIIGPEGVLSTNTALTPASVGERILHRMQQLDWFGWAPRQPLTSKDRYAVCANIVWEVLTDWVDAFFDAHAQAIQTEWWEIEQFSAELLRNAVRFSPIANRAQLADASSVAREDAPRATVDGIVRAVSPIASVDDLKQVCRYLIFHTTFAHTWTNDGQLKAAGESVYCSFSLRGTALGPESDPAIGQKPLLASKWLLFVNQLVRNGHGFVLANEDGDVPEGLRTRLQARSEDLAAAGYDAAEIRSRINI